MFSKKIILTSIGNGEIQNLEKCIDPVFSEKMVGDGYLFIPSDENIYSPIDGEIIMVADTKHAIGITSKKSEFLIHIGLESVALDQSLNLIQPKISVGQKVKRGDLIAVVNLVELQKVLPSTATPVLLTNVDGKTLKLLKTGNVTTSDEILQIS